MTARRLKVLMVAEAVTLAHVARPIALGQALDPARFEVVLACSSRYAAFAAAPGWQTIDLHSIPSAQFAQALAQGKPLYDLPTLKRYVADDLALIAAVGPDFVVGDFRLSLSVSARLAGVLYLAIANAYWTPWSSSGFALPVLPITRFLPLSLASALFDVFRPLAFALHCRPMNKLRALHGLTSLGPDLRRVYSDADHVLVPDVEAMYPTDMSYGRHTYVGPLMWSPSVPLPDWWAEPVPDGQAIIYLTLGSSGPQQLLSLVLQALEGLPVRVLASTAGAPLPLRVPANTRVAAYLPGAAAAARAQLVICNGGSITAQQALAEGVPVLGLTSNMDQFLNMRSIVAFGAGRTLRADRVDVAAVSDATQQLLSSELASASARRLQQHFRSAAPIGQTLTLLIQKLLPDYFSR